MSVILLLISFALGFSSANDYMLYEANYNEELNMLYVNSNIEGESLIEQLNNQYFIDIEFLFELGITPYSTLYMTDITKSYSIDYNIISSYELTDVIIDLDESITNSNLTFSETMSMRGVNLAQIMFFPIEYNEESLSLKIIQEVEITILEIFNNLDEKKKYREDFIHVKLKVAENIFEPYFKKIYF